MMALFLGLGRSSTCPYKSDYTSLRQLGAGRSHVKDWQSLVFLLRAVTECPLHAHDKMEVLAYAARQRHT